MKYVAWGGKQGNPLVSRLGFGTTRFLQSDLKDDTGFERCVDLVKYAISKGINYFDVAPTYANGQAERILGEAFKGITQPVYVAAKSGLMIDKTSDDIRRRIDQSLQTLQKNKIDFYHLWSVLNWSQYETIMEKGGLYDGVLQAKKERLIDHVCISLHCDPATTLRILMENVFEGITISLNPLNFEKWFEVLRFVGEKQIAVATMNSLGGGIIPLYKNLFQSIDESDDSVPIKALRFVMQLPNVQVALSGMPTREIIDENSMAVDKLNENCLCTNHFHIPVKENLCSGCNYCAPCTVGIPISSCMQAYNHRILVESSGAKESENIIVNNVFIRVRANGTVFPDLKRCIGCGLCEKRCTQKINIRERIKWLETMSIAYGYNNIIMRKSFELIEEKCGDSKRIAIWPAADYASRALDYWNNPSFEGRCEYVNASPAMWGKEFRGKKIIRPDDIEKFNIDTIVIMHFRLQNEIYEDLVKRYKNINIICLHKPGDIDWFNRMIG